MSTMHYQPFNKTDGTTEGLLLKVPRQEPWRGRPGFCLEYCNRYRTRDSSDMLHGVRVSRNGHPICWSHIDHWWTYIDVLHADGPHESVIRPIRSSDIERIDMASSPETLEHEWLKFFVTELERSEASPLHSGSWWLRNIAPVEPTRLSPSTGEPYGLDLVRPKLGLELPSLEQPESCTAHHPTGAVFGMRPLSHVESSRVQMWRKRVHRDRLPPVLLLYVSLFQGYLLLDGHDRLVAALAEGAMPDCIALVPIRRMQRAADPQARQAVWDEAQKILQRDASRETVDGVNQALTASFRNDEFLIRSRLWPLRGGVETWRAEVAKRAESVKTVMGWRNTREMLAAAERHAR